MDNKIKDIFELNHDPMLAVENGRVVCANKAAHALYGGDVTGKSVVGLVPDHALVQKSDSFVTTAIIEDREFTADLRKSGDTTYISLIPTRRPADPTELISDFLMNSMLSSLFNTGLALDLLRNDVQGVAGKGMEKHMALLSHNYYCLRHSLVNLNTALMLRSGNMHLSRRTVDLAQICSELVSTVSILTARKNVKIEFPNAPAELFATIDPEKTEQLILNIIANSLQNSPEGGRITLKLEKSGNMAIISIDDSGRGIPAEKMGRIFSCYEQELSPASLSDSSNGGLGLYVARGIAERHGGALIIESREGLGTSVRILLPLGAEHLGKFESGGMELPGRGMTGILTELAFVLDSECYTDKYLD